MANLPPNSKPLTYEEVQTILRESGIPLWVYDSYHANQFLNGDIAQQFNESYDEQDLYDDQEPHGI